MVHEVFLVGTALVLLGHAWLVGYAGVWLSAKALLFVFGLWLFAGVLYFGFADLAPPSGLAYIILVVPLSVCVEDFTRTWFMVSRVRKHASIAKSALAFAVAVSLVEIVVQTFDLLDAARYGALELPMNRDVEFFDNFFSSYSTSLAVIGINAVRPGIHYLLCLALFYSWSLRSWPIYAALIAFHVAFDVIVELLAETDDVNYPVLVLGMALVFALFLSAAAFWLRTTTKQHESYCPPWVENRH